LKKIPQGGIVPREKRKDGKRKVTKSKRGKQVRILGPKGKKRGEKKKKIPTRPCPCVRKTLLEKKKTV